MLQPASGLDERALAAIAALEAEVVAADGGRLKLEWGSLRGRRTDRVTDLLWWQDDRLLGFLGLYTFGDPLELSGMVAPAARRCGIATALLDVALTVAHEQGHAEALLVVPRPSAGGRALALGRDAPLDHSEHALVLHGDPPTGPEDPTIALRPARADDAAEVGRLLEAGFGYPVTGLADQLATDHGDTVLAERDGRIVATLRVSRDHGAAGVYGFVVDPAYQGRGIGRDVLRRVCRQLRAEGSTRIGLEVAVENDRALGLYTSIGFTEVTTEDYYRLRTAAT